MNTSPSYLIMILWLTCFKLQEGVSFLWPYTFIKTISNKSIHTWLCFASFSYLIFHCLSSYPASVQDVHHLNLPGNTGFPGAIPSKPGVLVSLLLPCVLSQRDCWYLINAWKIRWLFFTSLLLSSTLFLKLSSGRTSRNFSLSSQVTWHKMSFLCTPKAWIDCEHPSSSSRLRGPVSPKRTQELKKYSLCE